MDAMCLGYQMALVVSEKNKREDEIEIVLERPWKDPNSCDGICRDCGNILC